MDRGVTLTFTCLFLQPTHPFRDFECVRRVGIAGWLHRAKMKQYEEYAAEVRRTMLWLTLGVLTVTNAELLRSNLNLRMDRIYNLETLVI
jgi:hypothetical protein